MTKPKLDARKVAVCQMVASGMTIGEIVEHEDMPGRETIARWQRDDVAFAREVEIARHVAADILDEEIAGLTKNCTKDNHNAVRVQIDALKWRAGRLHPARYAATGAALADDAEDREAADKANEGARAELFRKLDALGERLREDDRADYPITAVVAQVLREAEQQRRLDPVGDRDVILDLIRDALPLPYKAVS